jgi:hypothetical protein
MKMGGKDGSEEWNEAIQQKSMELLMLPGTQHQ